MSINIEKSIQFYYSTIPNINEQNKMNIQNKLIDSIKNFKFLDPYMIFDITDDNKLITNFIVNDKTMESIYDYSFEKSSNEFTLIYEGKNSFNYLKVIIKLQFNDEYINIISIFDKKLLNCPPIFSVLGNEILKESTINECNEQIERLFNIANNNESYNTFSYLQEYAKSFSATMGVSIMGKKTNLIPFYNAINK